MRAFVHAERKEQNDELKNGNQEACRLQVGSPKARKIRLPPTTCPTAEVFGWPASERTAGLNAGAPQSGFVVIGATLLPLSLAKEIPNPMKHRMGK